MTELRRPVDVFFSYSHRDEELKDHLVRHLMGLERRSIIRGWSDRRILPGEEWEQEIDANLHLAQVVLLLVSSDFIASDYCFGVEVTVAMNRHQRGEARVIPVILRPCDWSGLPFSLLQALPRDGKAVTSSSWTTRDEAFTDVAEGIRRVVERLRSRASPVEDQAEEGGGDGAVSVATTTRTSRVYLFIEADYASFNEEDQRRIVKAIESLLECQGEVRIIKKQRGSVRLTIELPHDRAERLVRLVGEGALRSARVLRAEPVATDETFVSLYYELRSMADRFLRKVGRSHVIDAEDLVQEAFHSWLERGTTFLGWSDFSRLAAPTLRRLLVDHSRKQQKMKRGGDGGRHVPLESVIPLRMAEEEKTPLLDLLALDEALEKLKDRRPQWVELVELCFFAGLPLKEAAQALGISERTARRRWVSAISWLRRELA